MNKIKRVAYIEDDVSAQLLVEFSLKQISSMELKIYSNGKAAIEDILNFVPDIVLIDSQLPDLTGLQLLDKLKEKSELGNSHFIFCTAELDEEILEMMRSKSGNLVIKKPIQPIDFLNQLENILKN